LSLPPSHEFGCRRLTPSSDGDIHSVVPRRWLRVALSSVIVLLALASAGCGGSEQPPVTQSAEPIEKFQPDSSFAPAESPSPTGETADPDLPEANLDAPTTSDTTTAADVVATLPVKGRSSQSQYDRDLFGDSWLDPDGNGCDARNDALQAELTAIELADSCRVLSGVLADPYTGRSIRFVYGGVSEVDVDHVVALSDAWQKGASGWPEGIRIAFANDPLNLQPTDAPTNRQKGDGDAATWLPPNKSYRCDYVARQAAVKQKYELAVTAAEQQAMLRVLSDCPGHPLPDPR
jgi:hypothetical protein